MPVITKTTHDPYRRQQYNLQMMQGLGQLAGTLASGYKDYKMQEQRQKQQKQQIEDQREFAFKKSMFDKALENGDWGEATRIGEDIYPNMGAGEIVGHYATAFEENDTTKANSIRGIMNSKNEAEFHTRVFNYNLYAKKEHKIDPRHYIDYFRSRKGEETKGLIKKGYAVWYKNEIKKMDAAIIKYKNNPKKVAELQQFKKRFNEYWDNNFGPMWEAYYEGKQIPISPADQKELRDFALQGAYLSEELTQEQYNNRLIRNLQEDGLMGKQPYRTEEDVAQQKAQTKFTKARTKALEDEEDQSKRPLTETQAFKSAEMFVNDELYELDLGIKEKMELQDRIRNAYLTKDEKEREEKLFEIGKEIENRVAEAKDIKDKKDKKSWNIIGKLKDFFLKQTGKYVAKKGLLSDVEDEISKEDKFIGKYTREGKKIYINKDGRKYTQ